MKKENKHQEDPFKAGFGRDAERFPVPEDYFGKLKEHIQEKKGRNKAGQGLRITWVRWAAPLTAAAAVALVFLFRPATPDQPSEAISQEMMSEAAGELFRGQENNEVLEVLDSEVVAEAAQMEIVEEYKLEVDLAGLEDENSGEDPLAGIDSEDIEDYLVENLNINSEL